jgi:hypothetical protein
LLRFSQVHFFLLQKTEIGQEPGKVLTAGRYLLKVRFAEFWNLHFSPQIPIWKPELILFGLNRPKVCFHRFWLEHFLCCLSFECGTELWKCFCFCFHLASELLSAFVLPCLQMGGLNGLEPLFHPKHLDSG